MQNITNSIVNDISDHISTNSSQIKVEKVKADIINKQIRLEVKYNVTMLNEAKTKHQLVFTYFPDTHAEQAL